MPGIGAQIAGLSPEQRARLEEYLARRPASSIPRRSASDSCPLSFGQERLWLLDRLRPGSGAYNIHKAVRLSGPLDRAALARSLTAIVERHEVLRTVFRESETGPLQVVLPAAPVPLPVCGASHDALRRETLRPFDLSRGPIVRASLFEEAGAHILLLVLHHIAGDGWSTGVLFRELGRLYSADVEGRPAALPELPIQYADFACWQRERLSGDRLQSNLDYWTQKLRGVTPLALPVDAGREVRGHRAAFEHLALPVPLVGRIRTLASARGATLYSAVLAAFLALLHRYTRQADIAIGSPTASRNRVDLEPLIGFFVNTLVLRCDLSGNPPFSTLLEHARDTVLEADAHQELPFEKLVAALVPDRDGAHSPLVQVMLAFQNVPAEHPHFSSLQAEPLELDIAEPKFDLTVFAVEQSGQLRLTAEYDAGLFRAATIRRMLAQYRNVLSAAVDAPHTPLSDLPLLEDDERQQLIHRWNRTAANYPRRSAIQTVFERIAEERPEAPAVIAADQMLTYGELNRHANQLAAWLRHRGIGPEDLVAISMERSPLLIAAMLGILKAGAAYLPLDPAWPDQRRKFVLDDACAKLVLTRWPDTAAFPDANPPPSVEGANAAYVMYSSGSEGRPKGVRVLHRNVLRLVLGADYVDLDRDQVLLQLAPVSFDAATFEIWGALLHGARLVLYPGALPEPSLLQRVIREHGVTTLWLTSSLFNTIVDEAPHALAGVRQLLTGGEALSPPHVRRALDALPETRIVNGYGPTECTTFTTCYTIPRDIDGVRPIPIGRPIANTRVYILDDRMQPVPEGVAGDLWIGGDGVARGYINRPELDARCFVPDPFSDDPDARLYRSGDLARWLPGGIVDFLGRADDQLKIHGFRIEPGEIEAVLRQHPAVRQAAVLRRGDNLVAYVGVRKSVDDLRAWLAARLPAYMLPASIVALDALPINGNGKVDRRALPEPSAAAEVPYLRPRNSLEMQIAEIWEEVLNVRPIGVRHNFFDLGGHSLAAVQVMSRIERACGKTLPPARLFAGPTVEDLARALMEERAGYQDSRLIAVQPGGARPPFYFLHGDFNGAGFYCRELARVLGPDQPFYVLPPQGLDGEAVSPSIETMAAAHLRALLEFDPRGPYRLGGFCNGGLVAYEMARQLTAAGRQVEVVVMLEASAANVSLRPLWRALSLLPVTGTARRTLFRRLVMLRSLRRLNWRRASTIRQVAERVRRDPETPIYRAHKRVMDAYVPGPYAGRVALIHGQGPEAERCWCKVARNFTACTMPHGHLLSITRNLHIAAEHFRSVLEGL